MATESEIHRRIRRPKFADMVKNTNDENIVLICIKLEFTVFHPKGDVLKTIPELI